MEKILRWVGQRLSRGKTDNVSFVEDEDFMLRVKYEIERIHGKGCLSSDAWLRSHRKAIDLWESHFSHLSRYLPKTSGLLCLDVGCGTGPASFVLAKHNNKIVALEISKYGLGLNLARERSKKHQVVLALIQGDGYHLPLKDAIFDLVIAAQVIEHMKYKEDLIREMSRVLKPGGFCYITAPNKLWPIEDHTGLFLAGILPHGLCEWYVKFRKKIGKHYAWDVWLPTYWGLRSMLKRYGFIILSDWVDFISTRYSIDLHWLSSSPIRYMLPFIYIARKSMKNNAKFVRRASIAG